MAQLPRPSTHLGLAKPKSVSAGQFGMWLAIGSMASLFVATIIAYLVTRYRLQGLHGAVAQAPRTLYLSTAVLVGASVFFEHGLRSIQKNREARLKRSLYSGAVLAVLFLVIQAFNWVQVLALHPSLAGRELTLFTFYLLTGVHALHVLGGFVPLAWVIRRAEAREYSSSRHEGVRFCVQYWHFLLAMWLLLFAVILLG